MTYQIALLLNIAANSYQRALADEARETARKHGFELLPPSFANGSAMEQVRRRSPTAGRTCRPA
jgi:hypothetical protein